VWRIDLPADPIAARFSMAKHAKLAVSS